MSHVGAQLAPLRGDGTVGELDEVEGVVDIALQVLHCHVGVGVLVVVLILAGESYGEDGQWLCADLLGEEEVLIEAQTQGLVVVGEEAVGEGVSPAVLVQGAVLGCAHAVLPLVACVEVGAFHDAAAGEAEHAGLQVGEVLHEVCAQSVPVVLGEEGYVVEVYALRTFLYIYAQQSLGVSLGRGECGGVLRPLVGGDVDGLLGDDVVLGVHQFHAYLALLAVHEVEACVYGEVILHVLLQSHAEVAAVLDAGLLLACPCALEGHIVRVVLEGGLHVAHGHVAEGAPSHQSLWELEGSVLYHLCVETAVGSEVDVLEEDAVHGGLYLHAGLVGDYGKLVLGEGSE